MNYWDDGIIGYETTERIIDGVRVREIRPVRTPEADKRHRQYITECVYRAFSDRIQHEIELQEQQEKTKEIENRGKLL